MSGMLQEGFSRNFREMDIAGFAEAFPAVSMLNSLTKWRLEHGDY